MAEEINETVDNSFIEGEDFEEIDDFESEEFEEDTIYCQYCQVGFTDFDEWKAHEEEEAAAINEVGVNNPESEVVEFSGVGKEEIFCQYCQKGFTDFEEWKLHEEEEARNINNFAIENSGLTQTNIEKVDETTGKSLVDLRDDSEEEVEGGASNLYDAQAVHNEIGVDLEDAKGDFDVTDTSVNNIDDNEDKAKVQCRDNLGTWVEKVNEEAEENVVDKIEGENLANGEADIVHEIEDNSDSDGHDIAQNDVVDWEISNTAEINLDNSEVQNNFVENEDFATDEKIESRTDENFIEAAVELNQAGENINVNYNDQNFQEESEIDVHEETKDEWKAHEDEEAKNLTVKEHNMSDEVENSKTTNDVIYCQHCEKPFSDFREWKLHEEEEGKMLEWKHEEEERKLANSSNFTPNNEAPVLSNSDTEMEVPKMINQSLTHDIEWNSVPTADMQNPEINTENLLSNNSNSSPDIQMSNTDKTPNTEKPMVTSENNEPKTSPDIAPEVEQSMMNGPGFPPGMNGNGFPGMPRPFMMNSGFHPGMPRPMMNNPAFHPGMPRPMMNNPGFHPGMPRPMMNNAPFHPGMPMMNNPGFPPGMPRPMMNNPGFAPGLQRPMMHESDLKKRQMSQEETENKPDMKRQKTNPFHCKLCPNTYENKEAMGRHMKYHTTGGSPHVLNPQQIDILNNYYYNKAKTPSDDLLVEISQVLNIESHAFIQSWFRNKMSKSPTKNDRKPPISIPSSISISRIPSETSKIDEKSSDDQMKNNYVSRSFSSEQLEIMWSYFNRLQTTSPNKLPYTIRDEIARKTNLSPNSIASWFTYQRKRAKANNPQSAPTGPNTSQNSHPSVSKSQTMSTNPELNEKICKHNDLGDRLSTLLDQVENLKKGLDAARNNLEERISLNDSGFDDRNSSHNSSNNSHNSSLEDGNLPTSAQNQPNDFSNPPNAPNGMFLNPNMPFHPMMYGFPPNVPPQFPLHAPPQFAKNGQPQFPPNVPHFTPQGPPQFPPNVPPQFLPQYFPNIQDPHANMPPQFNGVIPKQEPQIKQEQC